MPFPFPGDLPDPGIEPRSSALQADSLASEPPGKPKSTGVGILSLLQGIFLTQELNLGVLHCRQSPAFQEHSGSAVLILGSGDGLGMEVLGKTFW